MPVSRGPKTGLNTSLDFNPLDLCISRKRKVRQKNPFACFCINFVLYHWDICYEIHIKQAQDLGVKTIDRKLQSMIQMFKEWMERYFSNPQFVILGLILLGGFVIIFLFGGMLIPVLASIVIAYLLEGMVGRLQAAKLPRMPAVMIVFVLFLAGLFFLIIWLLPLLSRQIGQLLQDLPSMLASAQKGFMRLPERYPEIISQAQAQQVLNAFSNELTNLAQQLLSLSLASVRGLISVLVYLVLVPLMVFFFLKDKSKIIDWMSQFLPSNRGLADQVWREVNAQIANYVRGKIWEILIIWVISYIVFKFLGLRFTMLISLFVGLSVLVPYVGVTVMFLPVGMIAYFQWGWQSEVLYVLIAYAIIQLLDGNLLAPLLLSEVVNLHPVAIIVAVLFFGGIWGLWGLFFAIPLATLVHSVIKAWYSIQSPDSSSAVAA